MRKIVVIRYGFMVLNEVKWKYSFEVIWKYGKEFFEKFKKDVKRSCIHFEPNFIPIRSKNSLSKSITI